MDSLTEDFSRPEDVTVLTHEDLSEEHIDTSDEVQVLQNSFLEVVHDENVQPKMQCLMMDSSFSMVTMQGEDSGIEWETTPSRGTTPWPSETGNLSADSVSPSSSGTNHAGKIIFVMDEEFLSKQKKTKERGHGSKGKEDLNHQINTGSFDNISGRPELVGFSEPNVKPALHELEEQVTDPPEDKEQKLFRLVSEGSEILNIIASTKVVTLDEEESKEMMDNLSYLESSTVIKAQEEIHDIIEFQNDELLSSSFGVTPPTGVPSMDPPGAPVSKPLIKDQPSNVDYFEAFSLIDAQAPGGPTVSEHDQNKPEEAPRNLEDETLAKSICNKALSLDEENAETMCLVEMTSELLDDVFYGNSDILSATNVKCEDNKSKPTRLSLKSTGSTLFGSQEDVLTPVYLPEGPPKIIDPILLEEPKAMAFLYTDLYEEATGCRKKEEDTESLSSEKSFHSRHSDREARGYLEKYVLIDETPVLEVEQNEREQLPDNSPRRITQDIYKFGHMVSKPDTKPLSDSEEVTDFFRSSANSSPCDIEPLSRSVEDEEEQTTTDKAKTKNKVVIVTEKVPECTAESVNEFPFDDCDWERTFDNAISMHEKEDIVQQQHSVDKQLPVAPPNAKASSLLKSCLDLEPLSPVIKEEEIEAGAKEEREEEKETADMDDVDDSKSISEVSFAQETTPSDNTITDGLNEPETEVIVSVSSDEGSSAFEKNETLEPIVSEMFDQAESTKETSHEQVKEKGLCIIL